MRPRCGLRRTVNPATRLSVGLLLFLAACTASSGSPVPSGALSPSGAASAPTIGQVIAAPGSESRIFAPNPGAIVVAIDPGHGGCLDWGVPNPYDNTVERSEKALTLAIALALRDRLVADGVTVVMTRDSDVALAGDDFPELGCEGDPFRDVNGDGLAGFGSDLPEATRTLDELSAHIDLVNLARADVLLSIHINSFTENGVVIEVAGTETYWTDETPWGVPRSERLARLVQDEVVAGLAAVAPYERQDRGTEAVNYYVIAPATTTGDPREPRRGTLMPAVLAEVGSMSLRAEADLLATPAGQGAIADALLGALDAWFAERGPAVRFDLLAPGGEAGVAPSVEPGDGPPFWAPTLASFTDVSLRLTNTGSTAWPSDVALMAGWATSDEPYLARAPALSVIPGPIPALAPGESVVVEVDLPPPPADERAVAWISLRVGTAVLTDTGSPALQLASEP